MRPRRTHGAGRASAASAASPRACTSWLTRAAARGGWLPVGVAGPARLKSMRVSVNCLLHFVTCAPAANHRRGAGVEISKPSRQRCRREKLASLSIARRQAILKMVHCRVKGSKISAAFVRCIMRYRPSNLGGNSRHPCRGNRYFRWRAVIWRRVSCAAGVSLKGVLSAARRRRS